MNYTLVRRKGQKNLRMHFNDKGELLVSCPYYCSKADLDAFIFANSNWIEKQRKKYNNHCFDTGDCMFLFGKQYNLVANNASKDSLQIFNDLMLVYSKKPDSEYIKKIVRKYYLQTLLSYVVPRTEYWCNTLNLEVPQIKIINATTRWGCCYKNKNLIKISLMTATLEEELIDMIVLHEVCHLVYPNHQKEFWNLMQSQMQDLQSRKKKLKAVSKLNYHRNLF